MHNPWKIHVWITMYCNKLLRTWENTCERLFISIKWSCKKIAIWSHVQKYASILNIIRLMLAISWRTLRSYNSAINNETMHLQHFHFYTDTRSCLILSLTIGSSVSELSTQTSSNSPWSQVKGQAISHHLLPENLFTGDVEPWIQDHLNAKQVLDHSK